MRRYKESQPAGFFSAEERIEQLREMKDPVLRLKAVIDWELFRPTLEELTRIEPRGKGGQRPFDPLIMFKALVLGRLYNLSDEALERQIRRDLCFMDFLGLSLADRVPDQKTIWEFREKIGSEEGFGKLFERFNEFLREKNLFTRTGRIVDASFVEVPRQRNSREENAQIKKGEVPEAWEQDPHRLSQKDVDARWCKKNHENYYGYKDHVKIDAASKLIEEFSVSPSSEHDSQQLENLVEQGDEKLWADSAYSGKACQEMLEEKGIQAEICEKGNRAGPLNEEKKATNRIKSRVRARVEHVFGFMTMSMGGLFQRCIGMTRNRWGIAVTNLVYNICRYEQIVRLKLDLWNRSAIGQKATEPA